MKHQANFEGTPVAPGRWTVPVYLRKLADYIEDPNTHFDIKSGSICACGHGVIFAVNNQGRIPHELKFLTSLNIDHPTSTMSTLTGMSLSTWEAVYSGRLFSAKDGCVRWLREQADKMEKESLAKVAEVKARAKRVKELA